MVNFDERSAGAVIARKQSGKWLFLLLHYTAGHWDFAKGHVERGEGEREAALREIEEETGIRQLELAEGFSESTQYFYTSKRGRSHKLVVYFLAVTGEKNVKLSGEHIGFEWLEYERAIERITYVNSKRVLEKAWQHIRQS